MFLKAESITFLSKWTFLEHCHLIIIIFITFSAFYVVITYSIKLQTKIRLQDKCSFPFSSKGLDSWEGKDDFFKQLIPDNSKPASSSMQNRFKIILPPFTETSQAPDIPGGFINTKIFCIHVTLNWVQSLEQNVFEAEFFL